MENGCKCLTSLLNREKMPTGKALLAHHLDLLVFGNHLMLQVPTRASAQLSHNDIAIAQHVDIEIDM
jgi:pterin-4a-carbinolamine dehydratase